MFPSISKKSLFVFASSHNSNVYSPSNSNPSTDKVPTVVPADKFVNYDQRFPKTAQPLDLKKGEKLRTQGHVTSTLM